MGDASAVQQQASGRLQSVYARGVVVLSVHTFVRVQVYCVLGISYLYRHTLNNSHNKTRERSTKVTKFRPISLLNVGGKVLKNC